jgi:hypothetical protein
MPVPQKGIPIAIGIGWRNFPLFNYHYNNRFQIYWLNGIAII